MERYVESTKNIIAAICEFPEKVSVEKTEDDRGILLKVKVAKADMSRVIGASGATADMIRKLVRTAGMLENAKVAFKVMEPDEE